MEDSSEDLGVLFKPSKTSQQGVHQIVKALNSGSKEIKDLLVHESNIIYECKVCKSLFRSIANFVLHKRLYCKEHCCEKMLLFENSDVAAESIVIVEPETPNDSDADVESGKGDCNDDTEQKKTLMSSATKIYYPGDKPDSAGATQETTVNGESTNDEKCDSDSDENDIKQEAVINKTSKIYYPEEKGDPKKKFARNTDESETQPDCCARGASTSDSVKVSPLKIVLRKIPSNKNAVLQALYKKEDEPLSLMDIYDNKSASTCAFEIKEKTPPPSRDDRLRCQVCHQKFANKKCLDRHVNSQHSKFRTYYPCPCCSSVFAQIWGISRHLKNTHRKSNEQIKKLRVIARKGCFQKEIKPDELPNSPEQKTESPVIVKCQCGRTFTRECHLTFHLKYCKKKNGKTPSPKKVTTPISNPVLKVRPKRIGVEKKVGADFVNSQTINWRTGNTSTNNVKTPVVKNISLIDPATAASINKYDAKAIEEKVMSFINFKRLQCRLCKKRFSSISNVRRHVAVHLRWYRFKCCYCPSQSYNRSDVRLHLLKQHANEKVTENNVESLIIDLKLASEKDNNEQVELKGVNQQAKKSPEKSPNEKLSPKKPSDVKETSKVTKCSSNSKVKPDGSGRSEKSPKISDPIKLELSNEESSKVDAVEEHNSVEHNLKDSDDILKCNNVNKPGTNNSAPVVTRSGKYCKEDKVPMSEMNRDDVNMTDTSESFGRKNSKSSDIKELDTNSPSTLVTRSGKYHKEDRMPKLEQKLNESVKSKGISDKTKNTNKIIGKELSCESSSDQKTVLGKSRVKKRPKSPWLVTKRKKIVKPKETKESVETNSSDVTCINNNQLKETAKNSCTSSDESEPRVSRRKQSFSNVLIDDDSEFIDSKQQTSHAMPLSRSSSLTSLTESPKKHQFQGSKTNPNSPVKGKISKYVISDDLGRFVQEVPVESGNIKKPSKPIAEPKKSPLSAVLKFDVENPNPVRLQNIGLLRKFKAVSESVTDSQSSQSSDE